MCATFTVLVIGNSQNLNIWAYIDIMENYSWFGIMFVISLITITFIMIGHINNAKDMSPSNCIGMVFTFLLLRDFAKLSKTKMTTKVAFLTTTIFSFFLFSAYTALLTSTMIFSPSSLKIETLDDLLKTDLKLLLLENNAYHQMFISAQDDTPYQRVYDKLIKDNPLAFYQSNPDAYERMVSDPRAVVFESFIPFMDYPGIQPIHEFKQTFTNKLSYGFPKKSEFRDFIDNQLLKMDQSGVLRRIFSHHNLFPVSNCCQGIQEANPLRFSNVFIPFAIVFGGLLFGVTLGLGETIWRLFSNLKHKLLK